MQTVELTVCFGLIFTMVDGSGLCWDLVIWLSYCATREGNPARILIYNSDTTRAYQVGKKDQG